jgi:acyl-CoA-binding protein
VHPKEEHFNEMHALYKQSTEGDCNIPKPGDEIKAKEWEEWHKLRGMAKIEAMKMYIKRSNVITYRSHIFSQ